MKLAFIIDPIQNLDPGHDSTVAMMEAACLANHEVWITQIQDLKVIDSQAWATLTPIDITPVTLKGDRWVSPTEWYKLGTPEHLSLEAMDVVLMRKDPPVTIAYLYATYLLDYVDSTKTKVINAPAGIRTANEKMYALQFTSVIPRTIVAQDKQTIKMFVSQQGAAVLKPLGGKAGEGILFLRSEDKNLNSLIELSTQHGQMPVMIQEYLPAAKVGDKRIILLNGEPIGAVNRVPTEQEFRGNMATGGKAVASTLTAQDQLICDQVKSKVQKDGLMFVGIDVIGDYLTEVNVTSPTGIREIDRLDGSRLGTRVVDYLQTITH